MDTISRLVEAFCCLPGVGPKSAHRMVFHLLQKNRQRGLNLATCLEQAMESIVHCKRCNTYTENEICVLCNDSNRDETQLCVVENPQDIHAIEQSHTYKGKYFVLMGKISPIDGLGPEDIHLPMLKKQVTERNVKEVVIALSPCVQGQATMHFIRQLLNNDEITISQLARGIPSAGGLEFLDSNTIGCALLNRVIIHA